MEDIQFVFRLLTLSQVFLLAVHVLVAQRNALGLLIAVTCGAFACYLVLPLLLPAQGPGLTVLMLLASSIPGLLWLVVRWLFQDDRGFPPWPFFVICLVYLCLLCIPVGQQAALVVHAELRSVVFSLFPQVCKLALVLHAVFMAIEGRSSDLVDARLKLRVPLAIGASSLAAVVITVEIWAGAAMPRIIEAGGAILMFVLALMCNLYLFELKLIFALPNKPGAEPVDDAALLAPRDAGPAQVVVAAMTEQRFYANHGATLRDLADHLGQPAHQLRRTINGALGYANFNQFLNHYRIADASKQLLDNPRLPVLTIALDVGFKSVSSFNTAFRAAHGQTPTQYRQSSRATAR